MIDDKNKQILNILQKQARTPNAEIARQIGMAPSAVLDRIHKLEDQKVIKSYQTQLGRKKIGLGMTVFIRVKTDEHLGKLDVGATLAKMPEVMEVHFMTGDFCYLIKVCVKDAQDLAQLLERFGKVGVKDAHSLLALKTLKETLAVNLTDI